MILQEVIERLENHAIIAENHYNYSLRDAFKLGIEAVKVIETLRDQEFYPACYLLLGETEERG